MTSWVVAALAGSAGFLIVAAFRRPSLAERIADYIEPPLIEDAPVVPKAVRPPMNVVWAVVGGIVGALAGQGDLFVSGEGRPALALGLLGAAGGILLNSMMETSRRQAQIDQLRNELPIVADALSLQILSGESIPSALGRVVDGSRGVLPQRLQTVLEDTDELGVEASLLRAASHADHHDERRLFDTLAHAHAFGGRVGDSLATLAADYRATAEREISEQGGRKAVTTYGPVLALMVPTALAFLLYPTLVGLQSLGGGP